MRAQYNFLGLTRPLNSHPTLMILIIPCVFVCLKRGILGILSGMHVLPYNNRYLAEKYLKL